MPVRCSCGFVDYRNGETAMGSVLSVTDGKWAWVRTGRQAVCLGCENYMRQRCKLIALGCRCEYERAIEDVDAKCPLGLWGRRVVEFVTNEALARDTMRLVSRVPAGVTRVIGVPRSGMIPASILAVQLQLPLYTLRDGCVVHVGHGTRIVDRNEGGAALLVDDTVHSGHSIGVAARQASASCSKIITAAIYSANPSKTDLYGERLPTPHLLEWNLFNSPFAGHLAFDMDGILCHNPPHSEQPLYLARHTPVAAIITARLEQHREPTERWLADHGVRYKQLIMWPGDDAERNDLDGVARWKAEQSRECGAAFYIESEPVLADAIRRHGTIVLCPRQGHLQ